MKKYSHRDAKIDRLIGKQVKVVMYDNDILCGLLTGYQDGKYHLLEFHRGEWFIRKSHIKKITRM